LVIGLSSSAQALTIIRNFVNPGNTFPGGHGTAGSPSAFQQGGGSLQLAFNVAADWWEAALLDPHTVTISYGWQSLSGNTLGIHNLLSQGGSPNRETQGLIRFDNRSVSPWFADTTPWDGSEYGTYTEYTSDLGGGSMNVGRVYTNGTGATVGRYDMVTLARHELGHALGMSFSNPSYTSETVDDDIDVTAPLPLAGSAIPVLGSSPHLSISTTNMWTTFFWAQRIELSEADILANAQVSQYANVNLNPVPEPGTLIALGIGAAVLFRRRRRRQI